MEPDVTSGMILLWSGAIVDIPAGYALCNGANGTPDLRDKFVVGAGSSYAVGGNGGAATHDHSFWTDGHTHQLTGGVAVAAGSGLDVETDEIQDSGTTDPGDNLPPYYALAYIMKT